MPETSIVIASYNNGHFLPEVLDSIFNQTYKDFEVIIVDDASTDNTAEILKPYLSRINYDRLDTNRGSAVAWSEGIRLAKGSYIALAAADDIWLPDKLTLQVNLIKTRPQLGLVYGKAITVAEDGQTILRTERKSKIYPQGKIFIELFMQSNFIPASTALLRKSAIERAGLLDETLRLCQDYDFYLRVARYAEVGFVNQVLVKYRKHPGSVTTDKRDNAFRYQRMVIAKIWSLYKNDPEAGLTESLYHKRLAQQSAKEGIFYFRHNNIRLARERLQEAIKYQPLNLKLRWYYLRSLLHL